MRFVGCLVSTLAVVACLSAPAQDPVLPLDAMESAADGDGPSASITVLDGGTIPEVVKPHTTLFLSASGAKAASILWIVTPDEIAKNCHRFENDRALVLPVGEHECLLTVHQVAVRGDTGSVATVVIAVRNDKGPSPAPDPGPAPVVDETLAKLVERSVAAAVNESNRPGFTSIAGAYESVVLMLERGKLSDAAGLLDTTGILVKPGLSKAPEWAGIASGVVEPRLAALRTTGKLVATSDYGPVWTEIAAGIRAGLGAQPPPPEPGPKPAPDVLPVRSLHVLIIEEKDDRASLPSSQVDIFASPDLRKWLVEHNVQWRSFDKDVDMSQAAKVWQDAMDQVRVRNSDGTVELKSGVSMPWVIASNGSDGYFGPLPKSVDELIKLLENYE